MRCFLSFLFLIIPLFLSAQTTFGPQKVINTEADGATSVYAGDFDRDGNLDVVSASQDDNKIAWYRQNNLGNFSSPNVISTKAGGASSVFTGDMDNDGDLDVISASAGDGKIAWYENYDRGIFEENEHIISLEALGAESIFVVDINGDGLLDVVSASRTDNKVAWYQNNGDKTFQPQTVIDNNAGEALSVYARDMDGDDDIDVLAAASSDNSVYYYQNKGNGQFDPRIIVTSNAEEPTAVYAGDIDRDGDLDVIASAQGGTDQIAWYENTGLGTFGPAIIITTDVRNPKYIYASDMDGDGDADVLSASSNDSKLAFYENKGIAGFEAQQLIANDPEIDWAIALDVQDVDGDGINDVISASQRDNKIAWYKNEIRLTMIVFEHNSPCIGANTGSLQIQLGGVSPGPYRYSWVLNGGEATGEGVSDKENFIVSNLAAGTYDFQVISAEEDTVTQKGVILSGTPGRFYEIKDIKTINSSNAEDNGSMTVSVVGGLPNYTYTWDGPTSGTETSALSTFKILNLFPGIYFVTVTDGEGEQVIRTITLLDETVPIATCEGALDVVILNDVSGSVDGREYGESKEFFVNFVDALNIGNGAGDSRAAIIEWSSTLEQYINVPMTGDFPQLEAYLDQTRAFASGTNPNEALKFGKNYLEQEARPDVLKVLILSTDAVLGQVSGSLTDLAEVYKAEGYIIICIAFDSAYSSEETQVLLQEVASRDILAPGAASYGLLSNALASNIVNLYVCTADPSNTNVFFFDRDGVLEFLDYTPIGDCPKPQSIEVEFRVTAQQQLSLPAGTPITFYYNDPRIAGATPILSSFLPCAIGAGSSEIMTVVLPINNPANVFGVLNDDGMSSPPIRLPVTDIKELVYLNNIDQIEVCITNEPTLSALKTCSTPIPVCNNTVIYSVDVCNISQFDATGVKVEDQAAAGFTLLQTRVDDNGCASGTDTFDIPANCCITVTFEYNASGAADGVYDDQDVVLSGPSGQNYIPFNGISTDAEDVTIGAGVDCPSDVVLFTKDVLETEACEEGFVTYLFTIDNQTNLALESLRFKDVCSAPVIWAGEPYDLVGLTIGPTDISTTTNAEFSIATVEASTIATFKLDVYLGTWGQSGSLENTATLSSFPAFVNGDGADISASSPTVTVNALPIVDAENLVNIPIGATTADLSAIITNGSNPTWTTEAEGTFDDPIGETTTYTLSAEDIDKGFVHFTISATSPLNGCGENSDTVLVVINCEPPGAVKALTDSLELCQGGMNELPFELNVPEGADVAWFPAETSANSEAIAFGFDHAFPNEGRYFASSFIKTLGDTCFNEERIPFVIFEASFSLENSGNTRISEGDSTQVNAYISDPPNLSDYTVFWLNDSTLDTVGRAEMIWVKPTETTDYTAYFILNNGCELNSSLEIRVEPLDYTPLMPTAFSPNNDGLNDRFKPIQLAGVQSVRLRVFNRWGGMIYEEENEAPSWDGTHQLQALPMGVYVYYYEYLEPDSEEVKVVKGNLSLIY